MGWRAIGARAVLVGAPLIISAAASVAEPPVEIVAVAPARTESTVVCSVRTGGLPDPPSRETLLSGLPSALVLAMSVLDGSGELVGGARAEVRIEPNLWEENFLVRTPLADLRVASLSEVQRILSHLGPLPVLPAERLAPGRRYRIRVRLAVHPLAPSEITRVRELFAGQGDTGEPDRREVSVGIGSLLRYFLGGHPDEDWVAGAISPPFLPAALPLWAPLPGGPAMGSAEGTERGSAEGTEKGSP